MTGERRWQAAICTSGVAALAYGGYHLLRADDHLVGLLVWLAGAVVVHDVILASALLGIGWLLSQALPRALVGYIQATLVVIAMVCSVGLFMVWRQGTVSAGSLTLLEQNYTANLLLITVCVAAAGIVWGFVARVMSRKSRPE